MDADQLLEQVEPLIGKLARRMPDAPGLDREDLMQAAREAVVRLHQRQPWDPSRGTLYTWAFTRVAGAMTDELRHMNYGTRFHRIVPTSLDRIVSEDDDSIRIVDTLVAPEEEDPDPYREQIEWLRKGARELERARDATEQRLGIVLRLASRGHTNRKIAMRLGLSEARVTQLRHQAISVLMFRSSQDELRAAGLLA